MSEESKKNNHSRIFYVKFLFGEAGANTRFGAICILIIVMIVAGVYVVMGR